MTIVVLLILAGITITYVMGDNSIFKKASDAKLNTELAKIEEQASLIYSDKMLQKASENGNLTEKPTMQEIVGGLREEGYTIEQVAISGNAVIGISLNKESMTLGFGKKNTIQVTLEDKNGEETYTYYVLVDGKYYKMNFDNGLITVDRTESDILDTGDSTAQTLAVTSGDETVATAIVDNTTNIVTVTATSKAGTATITVTYGEYTKTCDVKVVEALATGISLNETSYVVTGGDSWTNDLQLVATVTPTKADQEVTWKSSDETIATVNSNGLVKATAGGKGGDIKITATTKDGTNLSAECAITVEMFSAVKTRKTEYTDKEGNKAIIPQTFAVGTSDNVNTITGGLVIQDNEGNQFVWIPVGEFKNKNGETDNITLGRYTFNTSNGTPTLKQNADNYTEIVTIWGYQEKGEDDGNTAAKNLGDFITKTKASGGYYIARYEASYKSSTKCYSKQSTSTRISDSTALKSGMLWNSITQPNAATIARNSFSNSYVESDLINSYGWDTAIVFIQKYSGNTNYANQKTKNTGLSNTGVNNDKVCNIHDMASNCREWSTEHSSTPTGYPCVPRGGDCSSHNAPTFCRNLDSTTTTYCYYSFRTVLYVK